MLNLDEKMSVFFAVPIQNEKLTWWVRNADVASILKHIDQYQKKNQQLTLF